MQKKKKHMKAKQASDYFYEEHAEFVNKYGTKSVWKYRCSICGVRLFYEKSMVGHLKRLHEEVQIGHHQRVKL